jgi:hypothetical protein
MAFMQQEITDSQTWLEIDGTHGITFIPTDLLSADEFRDATQTEYDLSDASLAESFGKYYDGTVESVSLRIGFGARLSAPGYMDCTEWSVYDTREQAAAELAEMYGDDDDDSEVAE